jgi:hypothetical protein
MTDIIVLLDEATEQWRIDTFPTIDEAHEAQHWADVAKSEEGLCKHCDGFHPDQTAWAGTPCTVGTGIQWYHWRPENEEGW